MGLPRGRTNNRDGRPPGSVNRITRELREALKIIVAVELDKLPERIEKLDNRDRIEVLLRLIPFIIPKVEPVNFSFGEHDLLDDIFEGVKKESTT